MYDCCDHAIGWFDARSDWKESAKKIVKSLVVEAAGLRIRTLGRSPGSGSLGKAETHALRDAIWPEEEESEEEDE